MYKAKIEKILESVIRDLGFIRPNDTFLSIPEKTQFGDYSSNIPLQLSKQKHQKDYQSALEIANAIAENFGHPEFLERVEVAGAGFLNFFLKDEQLAKIATEEEDPDALVDPKEPKRIVVEYCDLNTHKMFHIGHLLPLTLGESLARLLEYQGHEVFRANYGSDIGLTVAKCLWGIEKQRQEFQETRSKSLREKVVFLGKIYAFAHSEYEKSLQTKEEIDQITNKIYNNPFRSRSEESLALAQGTLPSADAEGQRDLEIFNLWQETKEWSLSYFETIYSIFGTLFDRRINESEVDQIGKQIVLENLGKVFVKDEGAIIFPGEKYGLHNRVFINSKENPTYEGKEVGLASKYQEIFQADELRIFSDKAQDGYFKVTIAANEMVFPHMKGKFRHYSFGSIGLTTGKMSSRSGNVVIAEDLIDTVKQKIKEISPGLDELSIVKLAVGAVKFAFLKYSVSSDIVYDLEESVSIHGDTGPYVMYVYARIMSMLKKVSKESKESEESDVSQNHAMDVEAREKEEEAQEEKIAQQSEHSENSDKPESQSVSHVPERYVASWRIRKSDISESQIHRHTESSEFSGNLEPEEREILRRLEYFELIVNKATDNFQPNEIIKYLLNLAKAFNLFYEKLPVLGSKQETFRLMLCKSTAENIKLGLYLLGIETVNKM